MCKYDVYMGTLLRAHRKAACLTQDNLARGIGVSFQQIQKYEKGTNKIGWKRLLRFLEVCGCSRTEVYALIGQVMTNMGLMIYPSDTSEQESDILRVIRERPGVGKAVVFLLRNMK